MSSTILVGLALGSIFAFVWLSYLRNRRTTSIQSEFESRYSDQVVLVSDTRWGWRDFVINNVAPVLPDGAEVVWRKEAPIDFDALWLRRFVVPPEPPYAFVLDGKYQSIVQLRESLHPLKLRGTARDPHTMGVVAELLAPVRLRVHAVDRDGHVSLFDNILEAERSLEDLDVMDGEYVVIDEEANLYSWSKSDECVFGYRFVRSGARGPEVLAALRDQADGSVLPPDRLDLARSHGPATEQET